MPKKAKIYEGFKFCFDFIVAGVALILLSPSFLIIAIIIKLDSPGPVFFKQLRTGKNGKPFYMYKFRSMAADNDMFDTSCGDRYTRVGSGLRKTSVDELAQLINIVRAGYKVVLAHPERYATVQENFEILRPLAEMGVLFQCNLGSIIGQYGKNAKKTVRRMIKENMIFAFGSDIHRVRGTDDILLAQKKLAKHYKEADLNKVLYENPSKIIG